MKMVKRWGVMTLVAVLVLGTMGAALADEGTTDTEEARKTVDVAAYLDTYEWAGHLASIVFYWVGDGACGGSEDGTPSGFGFFLPTPVPVEAECTPPTLTGPKGQLNHGSMMSSFVHWLKDGGLEAVLDDDPDLEVFRDLPKGQLVKLFAQDDFGKGFSVREGLVESDEVVEAEDADGHGPPQWVKDKKADKAVDKAAKGKNK
jgi:hypothetical protein